MTAEKLVAGPLRGVREVLRDWKHETFTRWKDGIDVEVCTARCKKCQIEAALASLPSSPPAQDAKVFKTDVLGVGPWCVEFPDGEIITTRSEERANGIAAASPVQGVQAQPFAYVCPANCGCMWRDNQDGTMSLFGIRSESCQVCEPLALEKLIPVYAEPRKALLELCDIWETEKQTNVTPTSHWYEMALRRCAGEVRRALAPQAGQRAEGAEAGLSFKYFPLPWTAPEGEPDGAHCRDANGQTCMMIMWPAHPPEETEAVEQEAYRLMRLIPKLFNTAAPPDAFAAALGSGQELRELRSLSEKATQGLWTLEILDGYTTGHITSPMHTYCGNTVERKDSITAPDSMTYDDGKFIVACVNYVRAALALPLAPKVPADLNDDILLLDDELAMANHEGANFERRAELIEKAFLRVLRAERDGGK